MLVLEHASRDEHLKRDWIALTHAGEIYEAAQEQFNQDFAAEVGGVDLRVATGSYSSAAIVQHRTGERIHVFGAGSRYGRQDDFWTNFTTLSGTDWLIFTKDAPRIEFFNSFFSRTFPGVVSVKGERFHFIVGKELDALTYQETIIDTILDRYYSMPSWLPTGHCSVRARYE
jgi:hypothetical protein